jgi:hypothetical protein
MRKLAHIEEINSVCPIEGRDKIEQAKVLGWNLIVKKGEFKDGDKCVYVEIDSLLPSDNPDFAFLEPKKYKIKTIKIGGIISQGIVFPISILPQGRYEVGDDVTDLLKIKKIEDEVYIAQNNVARSSKSKYQKLFNNKLIKFFMRFKLLRTVLTKILDKKRVKSTPFPEWIIKTDETRIQSIPQILEKNEGTRFVVTEKLDGTSASFGLKQTKKNKFDFAVCSRNVRQENIIPETFQNDNTYWEISLRYKIESVLRYIQKASGAKVVVLQGEIIGEGIQKNKYQIKGKDFYAFNLVIDGIKKDSVDAAEILSKYGVKFVPILSSTFTLLGSVDEMVAFADGTSQLTDTLREGLVIRNYAKHISFKCVSNKFLLKHSI